MQEKYFGSLLIVLGGILGLLLIIAILHGLLPGGEIKDSVGIVQSFVTAAAVIVAGFLAIVKWELFRDFEPHLTISHNVKHRSIGEIYVHLDVTVTLRNSSKVKVELQEGFLVLQKISPTTDEIVERVYAEAFAHGNVEDFEWPVLEEQVRQWQRRELIIEPGESHSDLLEFIISSEVRTVQLYTFYYDHRFTDGDIGWSMATVYDIMD